MRCLECGAESAASDQVCAGCGGPIVHQVPISADPAEDETGDPVAPLPGESSHQAAGQRPGSGSRRNAWIMAGLGLVLLVAVTVLVASAAVIIRSLSSSRPAASSRLSASAPAARSSSPASPVPTDWANEDQLRSGDCVNGDPSIINDNPWPDPVAVVPCTKRHIAEVFFAGTAWPLSLAYPGDQNIDNQAQASCDAAFFKYDGIDSQDSIFTYLYIPADNTTWPTGDRSLVCVAYQANPQGSDAVPLNYSIKGSNQ